MEYQLIQAPSLLKKCRLHWLIYEEIFMTNMTTEEVSAAQFGTDAVLGKIRITIYKSAAIAKIEGGDGGPGTNSGEPAGGVTYSWNLPLANITTGANATQVMNTLGNCMSIIGAVAQQSCQSMSAAGSGNYDGVQLQLSGSQPYASFSASFPSNGQLQIRGEGIDLSGANQGTFAQLSYLPVGFWVAQPVSGCTKRIAGLFIED